MTRRSRPARLLVLALLVAVGGCVPGVDLSQLHPDQGVDDAADTVGDVAEVGDTDVAVPDGLDDDAESGFEGADAGDADADDVAGADADADGDVDADDGGGPDADTDAGDSTDVTVGPPSRVWGELTTSGVVPDVDGCALRGGGYCLRSDSIDPVAQEMSGGGFRLRGIVVGGGAR